MRLIDADKLLESLNCFNDEIHGNKHFINGIKTAISQINWQPTVESEPITRCKDCKNYKLFTEVYVGKAYCEEYGGFITENDYCSRGAKMDGKENEKDE